MANIKIIKGLSNNRYTLSPTIEDVDTMEQTLLEDFGEPVITLGGLVDVTTMATPLTGVITNAFKVGETVSAAPSNATGKVSYVNTVTDTVYVINVVGTFAVADTVTGAISGATQVVSSIGVALKQFEARYGVAPVSTANFTVPLATRRIPSQWANNQMVWTFDGNKTAQAENNAIDFEVIVEKITYEKWYELKSKVDNWEGEDYPIPLP